jgi:hypothetical protein
MSSLLSSLSCKTRYCMAYEAPEEIYNAPLDVRTVVSRSTGGGPRSIAFTKLLPEIELLLRKIDYLENRIQGRLTGLAFCDRAGVHPILKKVF